MMEQPIARWRVTQDATNDEAYAILSPDPVWNCFALADLEPPLRDYSQFAIASQNDSNERAICLILRHPIIGQVLSPFGREEGVAAILNQVALPERALIQTQEMHISLLQHYYQPETNWNRILRMALTSTSWQSLIHAPHRPVKQLTISDLPALKDLYTQHPESAFSADLFTQGIYFGAYEGGRIIAAGGTHALAPTYQIAVLGNILTAPEARGQGYATAITTALIAVLFEQHFSTVVLNVFEDNSTAIRIYQRLGFQTHQRFLTGKAILSRRRT
jgi:RimJ/RimL family protein N-acetyltransferase